MTEPGASAYRTATRGGVASNAEASSAPASTDRASTAFAAPTLPPGPLTIAALGDSLTAGDCDDSGLGGYPGRLQTLVAELRPGSRIVNYGRSGWDSTDLINGVNGEASQIAQAIAARPAAALVWIGSNDLWNLYEYGPEPMTTAAEQTDLSAYEGNIDRILSQLTGHGAVVFVAIIDDQSKRPVVAHPNPTEPAFPGTTPADLIRMAAHVSAYNDVIRREAAAYGAATMDFSAVDIFTSAATLCGDGNHPNATGYDRVAQIWFAAMEPRLR
jgi:lysophospholipase L1-like esterase